MNRLEEVSRYLDTYAGRRGLPERLRWTTRCVEADQDEVHRRVLTILQGAGDAADWSNASFQALVNWAVGKGVLTPSELKRIRAMHGFEVAS
jgi:hypothetical protein